MDSLQYQGYVIEACPHQLAKDLRWSLNITIERHTGQAVEIQQYSASNTFDTREEAVQNCLNFGRQIIDGKVEGCRAP